MPNRINALTNVEDLQLLKEAVAHYRSLRIPEDRTYSNERIGRTSQVFIAKIESAGIAARVGNIPGIANCYVYSVLNGVLTQVGSKQEKVYNLSSSVIAGTSYHPVDLTKFGAWVIDCPICSIPSPSPSPPPPSPSPSPPPSPSPSPSPPSVSVVDCLASVQLAECYEFTVAGVTDGVCTGCALTGPTFYGYNGTWELWYDANNPIGPVYGGSCVWSTYTSKTRWCAGGQAYYRLDIIGNKMVVKGMADLTISSDVSVTWESAVLTGDVLGTIVLNKVSNNSDCNGWPSSITLEAVNCT